MEIEYSNEVKGRKAYRFITSEMHAIAEGLKPYIKTLDKKIKKIEDNPNNEGQATFAVKVEELESEKRDINEIIAEFSK